MSKATVALQPRGDSFYGPNLSADCEEGDIVVVLDPWVGELACATLVMPTYAPPEVVQQQGLSFEVIIFVVCMVVAHALLSS